MNLNLFKKVYTVEQLTGSLAAFDEETEALQARQTELDALTEDALALVAVGEGDPKELKSLQAEAAQITGKLAGRPGARAKIERELHARQAEECRAARASKIREARAWQREAVQAADILIGAIGALSEAILAMQRVDKTVPAVIADELPPYAMPINFSLSFLRALQDTAIAGGGIDLQRFQTLVAAVEGQKERLGYVAGVVEADAGVGRNAARPA